MERPRTCTATSPRRCSMARRRASMREGPLAELFRATEAAPAAPGAEPNTGAGAGAAPAGEPDERTVDHVPSWEEAARGEMPLPPVSPPPPAPAPPPAAPAPVPEPAPPQIRAVPPVSPVSQYVEALP